MKIKFEALVFLFALTSCCTDEGFVFDSAHRNLFNKYLIGDTIYFANIKGDHDTILISNFDSIQVCNLMTINHKSVSVEIKHLPINHWNGGQEVTNNKSTYLDQELISVDKIPKDENGKSSYYVGFSFRDFLGEIKNIDQTQTDTLLIDIGVNKYWLVINELTIDRGDTTTIEKLIWTERYGLTGYYKRNGDFYKIELR
jgi:hypothetical protein